MTLAEILEWLKGYQLFDNYYIGKIDGTKPKTLGVYANAGAGRPVHAIGGCSRYRLTGVRLLVHWSKDQNETQRAARALFEALTDVVGVETGDNLIYYVDLLTPEPIDVGTAANNVYEYVINFNIYSRR